MLFENVEKMRIISFYFEQDTRCRRVYIAALIKTAQQSGNTSGKVASNPSIFPRCFVA